MPQPKNRSKSKRRMGRKTPQGNTVIYRRRVTGKKHNCGLCGERLQATHSLQGMSKSERTPSRKFGGCLCPPCTARVITYATRVKEGDMRLEEVSVLILPYVKSQLKK